MGSGIRRLRAIGLGAAPASVLLLLATALPATAEEPLPAFLRDRGPGVSTSIFGTFIQKGELLVHPFYEYVRASADEYHGAELGFVGDIDYLGKGEEHEAVLFLAYGLTEDLALELEGELHVEKSLERSPEGRRPGCPRGWKSPGSGTSKRSCGGAGRGKP